MVVEKSMWKHDEKWNKFGWISDSAPLPLPIGIFLLTLLLHAHFLLHNRTRTVLVFDKRLCLFVRKALSTASILVALAFIKSEKSSPVNINLDPVRATQLLLALVSLTISIYQIIISAILLYQGRLIQNSRSIFVSSLWYISHIPILTFYSILLFTCFVIGLLYAKYVVSACCLIGAFIYIGTYAYFLVNVNKYIRNIDADRYI